ncbi:dipeptidase [Pseudochrobactrum sp. HB0163]|uniref:dipeptidase n=1 Tax=Pseudochrobactrum sp. HB0163 TaxID=3450708 RepID=UPI003F6DC4CD
MQAVFDGHNDVLLRLWESRNKGEDPVEEFIGGTTQGHIDLPRARKGGLAGGLCAIYIPNPATGETTFDAPDHNGHYNTPLAEPVERLYSLDIASEFIDIAYGLERAGGWKICRSGQDIDNAITDGDFAAVLHMEGCEPLDKDLKALELFYQAGLRSLGPVWSRHNIFGHGVPFSYPMSPDTAPGLTDAGKELIKVCNRLGILIDLSHITEKGFWDVAAITDQPLVASHSNAHALTPVARNLTDKQLAAIRESNGLVGLNYVTTMLREDGQVNTQTPLDDMIRHIDYLVEKLGINGVALGSDFDGGPIPDDIADAAGTQNLVNALRKAGYGEEELAKICRENWLRVLRSAWHEHH